MSNIENKVTLALDALYDLVASAEIALKDCNAEIEARGGQPAESLGSLPLKIASLPSGGGVTSINGRVFDCGTFTLETDQITHFTVAHNLGMMPVAGFMWVVNPPLKDEDGNNLQYQYGKIRTVNLSDSDNASYGKFGAMLYVAGGERSAIKGSTYEAGNFRWTAETVTFCCNSTYPLRAGLKYQWLLIGGADA